MEEIKISFDEAEDRVFIVYPETAKDIALGEWPVIPVDTLNEFRIGDRVQNRAGYSGTWDNTIVYFIHRHGKDCVMFPQGYIYEIEDIELYKGNRPVPTNVKRLY